MNWAKWYNRVLDILVGGLLLVIVALVLLQVGARYIFGGAYTWSEEGNLFLWGWMILLAAVRSRTYARRFRGQPPAASSHGRSPQSSSVLLSLFLLGLLFWGGIQMVKLTRAATTTLP